MDIFHIPLEMQNSFSQLTIFILHISTDCKLQYVRDAVAMEEVLEVTVQKFAIGDTGTLQWKIILRGHHHCLASLYPSASKADVVRHGHRNHAGGWGRICSVHVACSYSQQHQPKTGLEMQL